MIRAATEVCGSHACAAEDAQAIPPPYPVGGGLEGNQTSPADKHNYTLLLAELRAQLDAAQGQDGKAYGLSIAAPAGPSTIADLELSEIHEHLSWINVMAYDFFGGWSPQTDFNAPLYASADTAESKAMNVDAAVQAYLGAGVPGSKLVVGVPFYGRGFTGAQGGDNGLHTGYKGMPMGTWEAGVFDYKDLVDIHDRCHVEKVLTRKGNLGGQPLLDRILVRVARDAPYRLMELRRREEQPSIHLRTCTQVGWEEALLLIFLREVQCDRNRFAQHEVVIDEDGEFAGGIQGEKFRSAVLAPRDVHLDVLEI